MRWEIAYLSVLIVGMIGSRIFPRGGTRRNRTTEHCSGAYRSARGIHDVVADRLEVRGVVVVLADWRFSRWLNARGCHRHPVELVGLVRGRTDPRRNRGRALRVPVGVGLAF